MTESISPYFTLAFDGTIWKTVADAEEKKLFVEVRNTSSKTVSFSAVDLSQNNWLWRNLKMEEPWWITLAAASRNILFFTAYTDYNNNPDKKSILAFDILQQKILWWRNDFAISTVSGGIVTGVDTKFGSKEVGLNVADGKELARDAVVFGAEQNFTVIKPFQYHEGSTHFDTVRSFLKSKTNILPVITVEYIEYGSLIVISAFTNPGDLANYLIVFNSEGELLLNEILGEHLKGIALDTFFILQGFLIFVKNKRELVCYKLL